MGSSRMNLALQLACKRAAGSRQDDGHRSCLIAALDRRQRVVFLAGNRAALRGTFRLAKVIFPW
jgi:hypothetical protein